MIKRIGTVGLFSTNSKNSPETVTALKLAVSSSAKYDLEKIFNIHRDVSVVWENRQLIWDHQFCKSDGTSKSRIPKLKVVADFFRHLQEMGLDVKNANDLDIAITTSFLKYIEKQKQRRSKTAFYRNVLFAIGTPAELVPQNIYQDERINNPVLYDEARTRNAVNVLKRECHLVIRRVGTREMLLVKGGDPRIERGGKPGDWLKPESGIFIATQVVGLSLLSWDDMNDSGRVPDFRSLMYGLNKCPGAPYTKDDGTPGIENGWTGQTRWFHPYADDIAPFVVLTMIRTGVNFSSIARVKCGISNWSEPYPFMVGGSQSDQYVFMLFAKTRGGDPEDIDDGPNIRVVSSTRPYSHPYRIFQFVEQLTAPLRSEILLEIGKLAAIPCRDEKEAKQLQRLEEIKDDLFIFRTKSAGLSSLAEYADNDIPGAIAKCLLRCGFEKNIRHLRSIKINFAYAYSGYNVFVAQLLAHHRTATTSLLYIRRKATLERHFAMFETIFALSISLIYDENFSYEALRTLLEAQGFIGESLEALMNPEFRTRWGNNCATPYAPPPGFDHETQSGEMCRLQNCIDGCPSARWFYSALSIIEKQHAALCSRREKVGLISLEGSSLPSQIERCERMMGMWKLTA